MEYKIPLFKLNFGEEEIEAVTETIRSKWISTGPKCEELEKQFVDMFDVNYAVSMSNCTDALHLSCILCDIKPGDEVLCPSLTFAASVNSIKYVGATPVFCDIVSPNHINIDPIDIEKKITHKTKAILVVHMAGFPAKMDEIMSIASTAVIEDACHGLFLNIRVRNWVRLEMSVASAFFLTRTSVQVREECLSPTTKKWLKKHVYYAHMA